MIVDRTEIEGDGELTQGAHKAFKSAVEDYAVRLIKEAKNIEKMERVGDGPAEITAAHIEEARWVSIRRMRLRNRSAKKAAGLKLLQNISSLLAGLGISSINSSWGVWICIVGVIGVAATYVLERDLSVES